MTSMRPDTLATAQEIDFVDAALLEGPRGPRIVLRPHKRGKPFSPAAFSLDVQAARMLSLHLQQFVQEAEDARQ